MSRWVVAFIFCFAGVVLAVWSLAAKPPAQSATSTATASPPIGNWQIVPSWNTSTKKHNEISGITCVSNSDCWAVGDYFTGTTYQTLIEHWDGDEWRIVPSANSSTTDTNLLHGVSCTAANDCWAVGKHKLPQNIADQTLIEHWDGRTWIIVVSANTVPVENNVLQDVTCISASDCWAVGSWADPVSGVDQILLEHWDGNAWTLAVSPSTGEYNFLTSIKCTATNNCWSVGAAIDSATSKTKSLVAHWDGNSWAVVDLPNAPALPHNLQSVVCNSPNDCWAVGYHDPGPGYGYATHIEHWDGTSWNPIVSPNTSPTRNNLLFGVACASGADCWAVGNAYNGIAQQTLIEHWDGTAWGIVPSPNTSDRQYNDVWSVSCASGAQCFTAGYYINGPTRQTLIERYIAGLEMTSITSSADGQFLLTGEAAPLTSIQIEASPDLITPFAVIGSTTSDASGGFEFEDANAAGVTQKFYRVTYP